MVELGMKDVLTFRNEDRDSKFFSVLFHHYIRDVEKLFNDQDITLPTLLGYTKDEIGNLKNSGIYEIQCNGCDKYVCQTSIKPRFRE